MCFAPAARAACTGTGTSWTCTAESTRAEVQAALDAASNEATITFAAGNYNWTGGRIDLNSIDGVTMICASAGACHVTHNGDLIYKDNVPAPSSRLHRISGFNFTGSSGTGTIWFLGPNDLTNIRIDHNTFTETSGTGCRTAVFFGAIDPGIDGNMYGVVDHNVFTSSGPANHMGVKNLAGQAAAWKPGLPGSAANLFIEDNVFTYAAGAYNGGCGCIDAWNGGPTVFRFNTATNCRAVTHGVCHGGPPNFEVYGNRITTPDGYRHIHHQGSGEMFVFDNDLTNGGDIALLHYRSCPSSDTGCNLPRCDGSQAIDGNRLPASTYFGYPCYRQPGRDANGRLRPIFAWDNVNDGGKADIDFQDAWGCTQPSPHDHVKPNRDYYNAVSAIPQTSPTAPFNGTTGMGFGSLANRPATCTTTPESADAGNGGVGYWATDAGGNWNTSNGTANDGCLFMCTATNTWSAGCHYRPFPYPHPSQATAVPALSIDDVVVVEGAAGTTPAVFGVSLSAASASAVTVGYATANQTATAGTDYQTASGTLTFAPGAVTRTVDVNVLGDTTVEPDETFVLNLSGAEGATLADGQAVGTISDDDAPPLARRELTHGSSLWEDLSGQTGTAGQDAFRLSQSAWSSYEVMLDGVSGDATPAVLERLAADNVTVLQTGTATGVGGARSLRWENTSGSAIVNQHVRVRSGGCTSACGADDAYRLRAWETTGRVARFNNGNSQVTVLLLQNPGAQAIAGRAHFWSGSGGLLATHPFTLAGRATLVLNTSGVSGLSGQSGSITVTHDGGYGGPVGKAVSLEPATGYSFDSPLTARAR